MHWMAFVLWLPRIWLQMHDYWQPVTNYCIDNCDVIIGLEDYQLPPKVD